MNPDHQSHRGLAVLSVLLAGGCASTGPAPASGDAATAEPPVAFETSAGEASYHLLLAELALERDQLGDAAREYRAAAELSDDPEIAQRAVTLSLGLGQWPAALASARRWVSLAPDDVEARENLASLYLRDAQVDAAVDELETLLGLYGDEPEDGFLTLTALLLEQPDQERARRALEQLLERSSDVAAAHYGMALLAMQAGDYANAQQHVVTAETLRPDWPRAGLLHARVEVAQGDIEAGLQRAADLARTANDPTLRLDYALLLANLGREGQARLELDLLLEEYPRMPGALRAAGMLEMRRGDLAAAQMHFTALLATGRGTWEAFFYLGSISEQRGQDGRAIRYYSQVRDGPLAVAAQARVAEIHERQGDVEAAVEHLAGFATAVPLYDAEMRTAAGEVLARNDEVQRALEIFDDVVAQHPDYRPARFARAFLYEQMDQVDASIAELRALLKDEPDDPIALNALGYTLADRTDRYREAYKLIRRALELDPDNPAIVDSMGWIEYRRGNLDEARSYLERAYAMVRDPEIAAHLGEVMWVQGETEAALALWQESLADNPDDRSLLEVLQRYAP